MKKKTAAKKATKKTKKVKKSSNDTTFKISFSVTDEGEGCFQYIKITKDSLTIKELIKGLNDGTYFTSLSDKNITDSNFKTVAKILDSETNLVYCDFDSY